VRRLFAEERARSRPAAVEDWSRESWQVAHDTGYGSAYGGDPCGPARTREAETNATIERLVDPLRLQVERGGLRLARLLDEALG
jgi:hypothetical protein